MQNQARQSDTGGQPANVAGTVVPFDRLRVDQQGAEVVGLVARERRVPVLLLLHRSRCSAEVAQARQIAMYLMHVVLQRSYVEVGQFFRRDRTTVAHACAQVEDMRERAAFDATMDRLEADVRLKVSLNGGASRRAG